MKKLIASLTLAALMVMTLGPALTVAQADPASTSLTRGTGGGSPPIVKAKWEMKKGTQGADDKTTAGAQFNAPGAWDGLMEYTVCAVVTDPNGAPDIYGVYADIYYPEGRAIHAVNPDDDRLSGQEVGVGGCGAFIEENTLLKLTKDAGYGLFCNAIRTNNNNLPVFYDTYTYDEICGPTGELQKEEAFVYCDDKKLIWEDPAGNYKVAVSALDKSGNLSVVRENTFEYLPLTKYEVDFTSVNYGDVMLNTHKKISGDRTFSTANNPTVRNLGNTRLQMRVAQDDMDLGKSSDQWNVKYDARVGNYEGDWSYYNPFKYKSDPKSPASGDYKTLQEILDLSETEEMDFSILITKWPNANTSYTGTIWLTAQFAGFRTCSN